jgi:glycosyltransferase involved in cell wall biosynthesis
LLIFEINKIIIKDTTIKFSIVIPLYNKADYVVSTLKSVLKQTYTNFEIIIIDDASTENSLKEVRKLEDTRIQIIEHEENLGLSAARNSGIRASKYNYIAFLDADDYWSPNYLEELLKLIKSYPNEKAFGTFYKEFFFGSIVLPKTSLNLKYFNQTLIIEDFFKLNLDKLIITQSSIVIHKEVFEKVGYYDEQITFAEDIDFYIRCFSNFSLVYIHTPLNTIIRETAGSLTNSKTTNKNYPDLEKYLGNKKSLDDFINFYNYCFCRRFKNEGAQKEMHLYLKKLDFKSLSILKIFMLYLPKPFYTLLLIFKKKLLKKGIQISSY